MATASIRSRTNAFGDPASPESRLDAKLRAIQSERLRNPLAPNFMPDLRTLPQPGMESQPNGTMVDGLNAETELSITAWAHRGLRSGHRDGSRLI